jgi:2-dehydropantoate 2-reductase
MHERILIYGAGGVGLGIASCLIKSCQSVDLIARPSTIEALKMQGLLRTGIFGSYRAEPQQFRCFTSLPEIMDVRPYSFILVTTKSFDSAAAAADLQAHTSLWDRSTCIILCQNGWGNAEIFTRFFPQEQVFNGRVITGFRRVTLHEVAVTVHADQILLGSLFAEPAERLQSLCQAIVQGGIPCGLSKDIGKDVWAKILYNCALNPLGAIFQVPYGLLGESQDTRMMMDTVIDEAFAVMQAAGYQTHWPTSQAYRDIFYQKFLPATYHHCSSTLQDIQAQKRTEIDALTGAILQLAEGKGLAVPYHRMLYGMIKFLEERPRHMARLSIPI